MEWIGYAFGVMIGLAAIGTLMETAYRIGHSNGYTKGMDEAAGWRDKALAEYQAMLVEALRQRDEARAAPFKAPPNPFAQKDVN